MSWVNRESRTPSARHTAIPRVLTRFIGRERETVDIRRLLATSRIVTLTGAAGCGKTRLASRVAVDLSDRYADGVHWIELSRLADPHLVPQAVARAVNVVEQPGRSLLDELSDTLADKSMLLVIDNCEHVLDACARLAHTLLTLTNVTILATSREPLDVTGEMLYPVVPLSLPPTGYAADDVERYDAIRLFVDRTRAILPNFALTSGNADAVTRICRKLDGMPLAIELASARIRVLTVDQLAAHLDGSLGFLPPATNVASSHHRTLWAAIDWSYDLLSNPEQVMLQRLSVFAGGCSLSTVGAICSGTVIERDQVLELLSSLVSKSLVVAETLQFGDARYSMLEPIRQYALEKLRLSGERTGIHDRYLDCFLQLTEESASKLAGTHQQQWLVWLEEEYANIRAALSWSIESERVEAGLRLAIALYQFWTIRDYVEEGLTWMDRLLALAGDRVSAGIRANGLAYAALLAGFRGKSAAQAGYGREAAALAEALGDGDKPALMWALVAKAYGARATGDFHAEYRISKRVIELHRELGNTYLLGVALTIYSFTAMSIGDFEEARAMLDEGIVLVRQTGDTYRIAMALNFSGDLARCERNYRRARAAYEESIDLLRELDAVRDLASALHNLGHTWLRLGDVERARVLFSESLDLHQSQRNTPGMAECLIGFAALAVAGEMPAAGARLLAAAVSVGGERVVSAWAATRMEYEYCFARAQARMTGAAFQAEQVAGRAYSIEQAVELARSVARKASSPQSPRGQLDDLTVREREVAALIAQGKSNDEIADELVVSKRTVEKHISNIRSKLEFTERTQIVRWAIEARLVDLDGEVGPQPNQ